ncbi:hypothetical protein Tcan_12117 [Toxocara canis]|uniref:Uncharacterized protein n=1 Tax=Toxocara canis TaxID=6265 RepID=A0A0B2USY8_TOXCA|nr:hypothetical protein Tcan_12117 [Toxocara canis]
MMAHSICIITLVISTVAIAYTLPFDLIRFGNVCKGGRTCSMFINALRDPRHLSVYSIDAWNKAIGQLRAYQQLFAEDDVELVLKRQDEDAPLEWLKHDTHPLFVH